MRYLTTQLLLLTVCLIAFPAIAADYYYWVDENGVTNFSQRSPPGYEAELVTKNRRFGQKAPTPSDNQDAQAASKLPGSSSNIDPDAIVDEERAALAAKNTSRRASNCEIGKRNLAQLQAFRRIRVSDEKGENRILSEEEKATKMDESRDVIRDNCSA